MCNNKFADDDKTRANSSYCVVVILRFLHFCIIPVICLTITKS